MGESIKDILVSGGCRVVEETKKRTTLICGPKKITIDNEEIEEEFE